MRTQLELAEPLVGQTAEFRAKPARPAAARTLALSAKQRVALLVSRAKQQELSR